MEYIKGKILEQVRDQVWDQVQVQVQVQAGGQVLDLVCWIEKLTEDQVDRVADQVIENIWISIELLGSIRTILNE